MKKEEFCIKPYLNNSQYSQERPVLEDLFNKVYYSKVYISCEHCKIFKSIYFLEHLWTAI